MSSAIRSTKVLPKASVARVPLAQPAAVTPAQRRREGTLPAASIRTPGASHPVAAASTATSRTVRPTTSGRTTPVLTPRNAVGSREVSPSPSKTTGAADGSATPQRKKKSATPKREKSEKRPAYAPVDEQLDELLAYHQEHAPSPGHSDRTSCVLYREIAIAPPHDRHALFSIGWMYYFALGGCARDEKKAWSYFQAAAHQDYALALYYCGIMKEHGQGVKRDADTALEYYRNASDGGSDLAAYAAAKLLEKRDGTGSQECRKFYAIAAERGHERAAVRLDAIDNFNEANATSTM